MNGELGEAWLRWCSGRSAAAVLGVKIRRDDHGLAHGTLGAMAGQIEQITDADLNDSPLWKTGPGWCSGLTGLTALALLAAAVQDDARFLEIARRAASADLKSFALLPTDGLCHGLIGTLAVAAGVARITADKGLLKRVRKEANSACERAAHRGWRLDPGGHIDQSWLTGAAGIAWGLLAIANMPCVNPLSPCDSQRWQDGSRMRGQA